MPLPNGYGVVIGTLDHFQRDPINNYGQYYHENVFVNTPSGPYHCAIDVDTKMTNDGIQWRVVPLDEADMKGVAALAAGWHLLVSNSTSGAIDNIRTAAFHKPGCSILFSTFLYNPFFEWLRRLFNAYINPPWKAGTSIAALNELEPLLTASTKLFIFGEPFTHGGLGVHNIHQNQGDPAGSQWWAENGIWQDGCTILQQNNNRYLAFLTKFSTQASNTDTNGHPVP
jgi:hypothetical protein